MTLATQSFQTDLHHRARHVEPSGLENLICRLIFTMLAGTRLLISPQRKTCIKEAVLSVVLRFPALLTIPMHLRTTVLAVIVFLFSLQTAAQNVTIPDGWRVSLTIQCCAINTLEQSVLL